MRMMNLLLPALYGLLCLAALLLAVRLCDQWRHMSTFAGWRFLPDVKTVLRRLRTVEVHESCLGLTTDVTSAAPMEPMSGLTLKAGSSSLLLATAAALTAPSLPDAERAAIADALAPIGMQPERIARRWAQQGACFVVDHEALLVQDGKHKRFFLCLNEPEITPTHVFFDQEYALSEAEWQDFISPIAQENAAFPAHKYYYTGLWEENGPASVVYLGSIGCRWNISEAVLSALDSMENSRIHLQKGPDSLLITAVPDDESPLQMLSEDAEPTAFWDALRSLRAQWKRRKRTLSVLISLLCCTCLSPISLAICTGMHWIVPLVALSALPTLTFASHQNWQLRLPKRCKSVLLPVVIACILGALLPLTLLFPATDFVIPGAPAIALGLLTMGTYGVQLALSLRQKSRKILLIMPLLLGLVLCLFIACTMSGPLYAAFGAVLGLLITLPVWCMRVQ